MSDLITRVAEVIERQMMKIGGFRYEGDPGSYHPAIEEISSAVIAEVRRYDVGRGPSDAEIARADWVYLDAQKSGYFMSEDRTQLALNAAAKVRAEEVTE